MGDALGSPSNGDVTTINSTAHDRDGDDTHLCASVVAGSTTLNPSGEDMTKRLAALVVVLKRFFSMPPIHQTRRVVRRGNGHTTHLFSTLETSTMMLILQYMDPSGLTISNMVMVSRVQSTGAPRK